MIKRIMAGAAALCCTATLMTAAAFSVSAESSDKLIDNAQLLSQAEAQDIRERLFEVSESTGWDVVVYTNNDGVDLDDNQLALHCNEFYENNRFGKGENKSGVMLTVDMSSRCMFVLTKGDARLYFDDSRTDSIVAEIQSSLKNEDFYSGCADFAASVSAYYNADISDDGTYSNIQVIEKKENPFLYSLKHVGWIAGLAGLVIGGIFIPVTCSRYKHNGRKGVYDLRANSDLKVLDEQDEFLYKNVTYTTRSSSSSSDSSSSSGGSSSSSSFGGGGARF